MKREVVYKISPLTILKKPGDYGFSAFEAGERLLPSMTWGFSQRACFDRANSIDAEAVFCRT